MRASHKNKSKCLYLETPLSPRISTLLKSLLISEVQQADSSVFTALGANCEWVVGFPVWFASHQQGALFATLGGQLTIVPTF